MSGVPPAEVKDEMIVNAARREELTAKLAAADAPPPLLHSGMADLYRQKVTNLTQALEHPETRTEASEALRGLIDAIVLTPNQGELQIELKGNLAAMLGAAQNAKRSPETGDLSLQVVMVAGARNQLYRIHPSGPIAILSRRSWSCDGDIPQRALKLRDTPGDLLQEWSVRRMEHRHGRPQRTAKPWVPASRGDDAIRRRPILKAPLRNRVSQNASTITQVIALSEGRAERDTAWHHRPFDTFKRFAPEVIKANQPIEVWAVESTEWEYKLLERDLNARFDTMRTGWTMQLG